MAIAIPTNTPTSICKIKLPLPASMYAYALEMIKLLDNTTANKNNNVILKNFIFHF